MGAPILLTGEFRQARARPPDPAVDALLNDVRLGVVGVVDATPSSFSKPGLWVLPPGYIGDEYQRWRNPTFSESYFNTITQTGIGSNTAWHLNYTRNDCGRYGGKKLKFRVTVAANGTIIELLFINKTLAPLQWRRHKTDDETFRPTA